MLLIYSAQFLIFWTHIFWIVLILKQHPNILQIEPIKTKKRTENKIMTRT